MRHRNQMEAEQPYRQFMTSCRAANLALRTIAWYEQQIGGYLRWLESETASAAGVGPQDFAAPEAVEAFLAAERERGMSPSTVRARYRGLHAWFSWLKERKRLRRHPLETVKKPRVPDYEPRWVKPAEFRRLYDGIDGAGWLDDRDRLILILLYKSGLRVGELVKLCPSDIDTVERIITVRNGKGSKDRPTLCSDELRNLLPRYLYQRPAYGGSELLVGSDGYADAGGPLTASGVRQMLRRRCRKLGTEYLSPHTFRHGFAMALLNNGFPMSALATVMGHTTEEVTKLYARWLTEGLHREYDEAQRRLRGRLGI